MYFVGLLLLCLQDFLRKGEPADRQAAEWTLAVVKGAEVVAVEGPEGGPRTVVGLTEDVGAQRAVQLGL